jgi:hypothetical protein
VRVTVIFLIILKPKNKLNKLFKRYFSYETMENDSIYIYGIVDGKINSNLESNGIGEENNKAYCISFKDITAIVSNTQFIEYDPTEDNVLAHELVIQELIKKEMTIAPMRFCTILKTRSDVLKLLESAYYPFKKNILKIRNKKEFGVKLFLDIEKLKKEASDILKKSVEIAEELHNKLKEKSEDIKLDEQITEDMIMNASYLIRNEKVKEFHDAIYDFDKNYTDKIKIRISGPTAPYNFVDMPKVS